MTRLAALLARPPADPRTDGALLAAFLADRDEPAFAELVRRHGRLVWCTCRRLLPDPADAEDAFQATFLVLVRRAARLTRAATAGPWLYRVASLTARNLRRKNARRLARTEPLSAGLNPAARPEPSPVGVDDVLAGLSERERAAIVLCLLDGLTHREAADRLGLPEGTVSARVSRGLAKLRDKLGAEPAAFVVGSLVPAATAEAAVRAAVAYQLAATATPAVASLVDGVLRMFWLKKATATGLAACALLTAGMGIGVSARSTTLAADDPPSVPATKPAGPAPFDETAERLEKLEKLARSAEANQKRIGGSLATLRLDLEATQVEYKLATDFLGKVRAAIEAIKRQEAEAGSAGPHRWEVRDVRIKPGTSISLQLREVRGKVMASTTLFPNLDELTRFLTRVRGVSGWPDTVVIRWTDGPASPDDRAKVRQAVQAAGFGNDRIKDLAPLDGSDPPAQPRAKGP